MGDSGDDRAEDDGCNRHLDELDEPVPHRLDPVILAELRRKPADDDTKYDCHEHLDIENLVNWLFLLRSHRSRHRISSLISSCLRFPRHLYFLFCGGKSVQ